MNNLSLKIRAIPSNSFVFLDEKLIKMKKINFQIEHMCFTLKKNKLV